MDFKNTVAPLIVGLIIGAILLALNPFGAFRGQVVAEGTFTIISVRGGYMVAIETKMPEEELRARVHNMLHPEGPRMVVPQVVTFEEE